MFENYVKVTEKPKIKILVFRAELYWVHDKVGYVWNF